MKDETDEKMMPVPKLLQKGDDVAIVATARKVSRAEIEPAIRLYETWGLNVLLPENIYAESDQFAGSDSQRAADLQWALDNAEIKAVFCARGGYGTVRIIDQIDFSRFTGMPKWIVGYSDVTVLHSHIHATLGIPTIHATMPLNIDDDAVACRYPATESLRQLLFEGEANYRWTSGGVHNTDYRLQKTEVEGPIVGGNLSILYSLCGSASDIDTSGKILLIEDLDEYLYHIDRMMQNLRRTGKLSQIKALVVGGMTEMHDNTVPFGKTAKEIIYDTVKDYGYPVCFDAPFGHLGNENRAIALGQTISLQCNSDGSFAIQQTL